MHLVHLVSISFVFGATVLLLYAHHICRLRPPNSGHPSAMMSKGIPNVLTADTVYLQSLLKGGKVNSTTLSDAYVGQINKHDHYLHAMTQITPLPLLKSVAEKLDLERQDGKIRGPLHGVPIIIKVPSHCQRHDDQFSNQSLQDNIANHPDLGLRSTAGSLALYDSRPPRNAKIVDMVGRTIEGL